MRSARYLSVAALTGLAVLVSALPAAADGHGRHDRLAARPDTYRTRDDALHVGRGRGVLANDSGDPLTLVGHTDPANGTLDLRPDGSFSYTPNPGFTGTDTFSYTVTDAVRLYSTHLPPLATIGGVPVTAGGYGSSLYPVPGSRDEYYGLTDRGPNVDGPNGVKVEPLPGFDPAIGRFRLVAGRAVLERSIPLRDAAGNPYSGRVNSQAGTGETIVDLDGNVLPPDPNGYDSEGLVALPDGTFWVSDEYGPFITHFDRYGRQIGRLSPFDGTLPGELRFRVPNKGMEGLTVTPDGSTLVGIVQSALAQPDLTVKPGNVTTLRIVTYGLRTHAVHEYLYLLDNPKANNTAVSEITALSDHTFLVDERDGKFPPASYKKLWRIDLTGATDVGPGSTVAGTTYDASRGGLLVGGQTIDALVGTQDTATATATLAAAGITPAAKGTTPVLDVTGLLTTLDPQARFFSHDKVEGVAVTAHGTHVVISNDSDFGIDGVTNATPPYRLHAKVSPTTGRQDDGEFLDIDLTRLPAATGTATVTFRVGSPGGGGGRARAGPSRALSVGWVAGPPSRS